MKKIYFVAVAAALALSACDNDNSGEISEVPTSETTLRILASINDSYITRAEGGSWSKDDKIGVITTVGDLASDSFHPYVNLKYTADNAGAETTFTGPEMLFYNHLTISGYYPYQGSEGTAPGGNTDGYLIKTHTRIDNQFKNNKAIDFLHATKTGIKLADAEQVELAFSHKMTKLTFTFMSNSDKNNTVNVANLAKYQIEGLVMDGSFNTLTGECIADSDKPAEDLVIDGLFDNNSGTAAPESRTMKSLIVFPQTPKGKTQEGETQQGATQQGDVTLRLYIDEAQKGSEEGDYHYQVYFCTIKFGENVLKPGYHYNFKVNITKAGLQLGEITIADWGEPVKTTIIATIDGEEPKFEEEENEKD